MSSLIFLHNELMNPFIYNDTMHLPLDFISYGITDGYMYRHFNNKSVFILPNNLYKERGNSKIYGAIFAVRDIDFYISLLDAYHACYKNKIQRNHIYDIHHRDTIEVVPIHFKSLSDLSRLKYREGTTTFNAEAYFGNPNHPKIKQRIGIRNSHRVVDGIDKNNFKELYRRVKNEL